MLMWLYQRRPRQPQPALRDLLALPIVVLLLSSSTSATSAAKQGSEQVPIRLLLLGESGAGKTTFLDLLLWYAEVAKLPNPAKQANVASIRQRHNKDNENPDNPNQRQTKLVQTYKVMLNGTWFEILDVPGFNDNTGKNQDTVNSNLIVESVREGGYLNAILLVLKGRQPRVTPGLNKVLDGISPFLPKSLSASNTMLIFTRVELETDLKFPVHKLGNGLSGVRRLLLENPFCKFACGNLGDEELQEVLDDAVQLLPNLDDMFKQLNAFAPVSSAVLDTMEINRAYKQSPLRIVLAGPSGAGKTLFCEFLRFFLRGSGLPEPGLAELLRSYQLRLGQEASFRSDPQKVSKYTETLRGGGSVEIYDTPGLLSTDGPTADIEHIMEIDNQLRSLDYVDAVLLVFNGTEKRHSADDMKFVLKQLSAVFPPAVYPNIALLFSRRSRNAAMMIEPYLRESQFSFTSEEVKSRSFFLDNPLHAMAEAFDPNEEGQTIAPVVGRDTQNILLKRYNDGVKELNRLLPYFTSGKNVVRCANPNFGAISSSETKISESLKRISSIREKQYWDDCVGNTVSQAHKMLQQHLSILQNDLKALPISYTNHLQVLEDLLNKQFTMDEDSRASLETTINESQTGLPTDSARYLRELEDYLSEQSGSHAKTRERLEDVRSRLETLSTLPSMLEPFDLNNYCSINLLQSTSEIRERVKERGLRLRSAEDFNKLVEWEIGRVRRLREEEAIRLIAMRKQEEEEEIRLIAMRKKQQEEEEETRLIAMRKKQQEEGKDDEGGVSILGTSIFAQLAAASAVFLLV